MKIVRRIERKITMKMRNGKKMKMKIKRMKKLL